jgi:hypothetical protein
MLCQRSSALARCLFCSAPDTLTQHSPKQIRAAASLTLSSPAPSSAGADGAVRKGNVGAPLFFAEFNVHVQTAVVNLEMMINFSEKLKRHCEYFLIHQALVGL